MRRRDGPRTGAPRVGGPDAEGRVADRVKRVAREPVRAEVHLVVHDRRGEEREAHGEDVARRRVDDAHPDEHPAQAPCGAERDAPGRDGAPRFVVSVLGEVERLVRDAKLQEMQPHPDQAV